MSIAAVCTLAGCGGGDYGSTAGGGPFGGGSFAGGAGTTAGGGAPSVEPEIEVRFEPPAVGQDVLFATNSDAARVAIVRADDFSIETVPVGAGPLPAVAASGRNRAISIDRDGDTLTLLDTSDEGTTTRTLPLSHEANRVAFSPDGDVAIVYEADTPGTIRRNLHDASIVVYEDEGPRIVRMVVGFGPIDVRFEPGGGHALVVTEDGINRVDLDADALPAEGLSRPPLLRFGSAVVARETLLSPDARYALATLEDRTTVLLLELATGTVSRADLSDAIPAPMDPPDGGTTTELVVSDIDFLPDGSEVLATLRSHEQVVRLPVGADFADALMWTVVDLEGEQVGALQVAASGAFALGYTTTASAEWLTRLALDTNEATRILLRKTVRGVAIAPGDALALVLHRAEGGSPDAPGIAEEERIDRAQGFSLVDLDSGFARLTLTAAEPAPDGFALDATGDRLLLALRDDDARVREVQVADLDTFAIDVVPLVAPPTTLGSFDMLDRAFIGQEADGGRVTFYLWETGETHTVAGFELGAGVRR